MSKSAKPPGPSKNGERNNERNGEKMSLRLYVAGQTPKSLAALSNLKKICAQMNCEYQIEIIDLAKNPQLAKGDQILAIPTLVRSLPEPIRKIIGDLSNTEKVLVGLNFRPSTGSARAVGV